MQIPKKNTVCASENSFFDQIPLIEKMTLKLKIRIVFDKENPKEY